jgi:hypothetical protein
VSNPDYNLEASRLLDAHHIADPTVDPDGCIDGNCHRCPFAVGWRDDTDDPAHYTLFSLTQVREWIDNPDEGLPEA